MKRWKPANPGFIALVDTRVRQHLRAHQRHFLPQDGFRFRRRLDKSVPRDNFRQPVVMFRTRVAVRRTHQRLLARQVAIQCR